MKAFSLGFYLSLSVVTSGAQAPVKADAKLVSRIPSRPVIAMTGSEFINYTSGMNAFERENAILREIDNGNIPDFLRKLKPVQLKHKSEYGLLEATAFVMPDYLAIGSNEDYVLIPMNRFTAMRVARNLGFTLPTTKIVDAVSEQSSCKMRPRPMRPSEDMDSNQYYREHNDMIKDQRCHQGLGMLISGHKKDVVIANALRGKPDRIAIYGWHQLNGEPIQPLSTVHNADYADYSHGIRLVADKIMIEGQLVSIYDVMKDPVFNGLVNDDGQAINVNAMVAGSI